MKTDEVEKLLNAYYEGETSEREDELLLQYFRGDDVPSYLMKERDVFLAIHQDEEIEIPDGLENHLNAIIDREDRKEKKNKAFLFSGWITSIAAGFLLLFFVGVKTLYHYPEDLHGEHYPPEQIESPEEVLVEILTAISLGLNGGLESLETEKQELKELYKRIRESF